MHNNKTVVIARIVCNLPFFFDSPILGADLIAHARK